MKEIKKKLISPLIIIVAIVLQLLWRSWPHFYVDLFNFLSIGIILLALRHGEGIGALSGTLAGLIQDSMTLHVFGLAGLTKTGLGFFVGLAYRKLNLASFLNQSLFLFTASSIELVLWTGLANLIFPVNPPVHLEAFWFQPFTTALISSFVFRLLNR